MTPKLWSHSALTIVMATSLFAAGIALAAGPSLAPQVNREGAVTVKVTPLELSAKSPVWRFEVVFDTHVAELNHDVPAIATLSAGGKELRALRWEGDKPGGHHRKGVLQFDAVNPAPVSVALTLRGVGGAAERRFEWTLPAR